jgi:hypothetical protein
MDLSFEGVHSWDVMPQGYKAELNFLLRFPEGLYPTRVTALGSDDPDTGNRVWQIVFQETGVRQQERQWTTLGKLIIELQHHTYKQLHDWQMKFVAAGAKAAEPLIRLEGKVPPDDMRSKIAEEIVQPGALNIIPGGPTRPLGYAQLIITDNSVEITSVLEATLPSVGKELNTGLTQRVKGDALIKEMLRLAGPDWRQQPINTEQVAVLKPYQFELETVDINIRPSLPKPGPRTVTAEGPAALPPASP